MHNAWNRSQKAFETRPAFSLSRKQAKGSTDHSPEEQFHVIINLESGLSRCFAYRSQAWMVRDGGGGWVEG